MKKVVIFTFMLFILQVAFSFDVKIDSSGRPLYAADRIKVKLSRQAAEKLDLTFGVETQLRNTGIEEFDNLVTSIGVTKIDLAHRAVNDKIWEQKVGYDRWFLFFVPIGTDIERTIAEISNNKYVEHVNPEYLAYLSVTPNDPYFDDCWGHDNTASNGPGSGHTVGFDSHAEEAWDDTQGYGSSSTILAIIDTGTDYNHVDLNDNCVAGYDYGDNDNDPMDDSSDEGHGTCCAGVAAGEVDNGIGVAGVAGDCSIMPLKISDSGGSLMFSYIDNAITHCGDNDVDIASMSFGADISQGDSPSTDTAISYAYNNGVTMLAATANNDYSHTHFPSNHEYVIAVGAASPCEERKRASSCDGQNYWGSNYGVDTQDNRASVDVIAPTILNATDVTGSNGYSSGDYLADFNGTSCATPYAAGVAALIKSKDPTLTPTQVRYYLISTATDIIDEGPAGWDRYTGYGMVNAAAAVGAIASSGFPSCNITNPTNNEIIEIGTSVTITVNASDPSRSVSNVKIYIDNVLKTTDYSAPYQYTWNTTGETLDFHTIKATATDNESNATDHQITVIIANPTFTIFEDGFETNLGWTLTGEFERNAPGGLGGNYGNADPTSAFEGSNILGVDLTGLGTYSGDYEINLADRAYTATSPVIDCSDYTNVALSFYRWLNVEQLNYDHAYIDVSTNGFASYTNIWSNSATIEESSWSQANHDLSSVADGNTTVQIRFSIGSTDESWQYSGWNIDNLVVSGEGSGLPDPTITVTSPNGGEDWNLGTTHNVTWNSSNTSGNVKILLYSGGNLYNTISSNTTDDGIFSWNIPSGYAIGTGYTIRIEDVTDNNVNDVSNGNFTLSVTTTPDITTTPAYFNKTLAQGATGTENLTIGNAGTASLNYTATFSYTTRNNKSYTSEFETIETNISYTDKKVSNSDNRDCTFTIDLYDDYGDGWNGGSLDVMVNGSVVLDNITLASAFGPVSFDIPIVTGETISTSFTAGGWAYECSYFIYDNDGVQVASDGTGGVEPTDLSPFSVTCTNDPILSWLTLDGQNQVSGSINPGSSDDISVLFDTVPDNLTDGIYNATIEITSNDPDQPTITIPVTLTVSQHLDVPQNVTITATPNGADVDVLISWTSVQGATSYTVYRSDNSYAEFPNEWTSETGIIGTTFSYTTSRTRRFYRVTANN